jgi:hypothetical protein
MSFEEFMRQPRTDLKIASYHGCLAALQRVGLVDEDLRVVARSKARR